MTRLSPLIHTSLALVLVGMLLTGCAAASGLRLTPTVQTQNQVTTPNPLSGDPFSPNQESTLPGSAQAEPAKENPPVPTVACKDSLVFLKDLTIPDGTTVGPDSTLDKRWEVENNGDCNWGENYRVRLIAGPELGAQKEQALYPARSGTRAAIRIQFKAPVEPGNYRSAWQAYNDRGEPFGDPFFIEISVEAP